MLFAFEMRPQLDYEENNEHFVWNAVKLRSKILLILIRQKHFVILFPIFTDLHIRCLFA